MSSRTAAARKRLQSPSPPTPPSGSSKSPFKLSVFKNSNKGRSLRRSDERLPSSSLSDSHLPRIPENDSALHNELGHITDPALPVTHTSLSPQRRTYNLQQTPSPSFGPNQRPHHVHATGHLAQEHNTPANYFSDKDVSPGNRGVRHRFVSEDMPTTKSSSLVQLRSSETRHPVIGSAAPIQSSSLTTLPVQLNRLALNSKQSCLSPPSSSASSCFDAVAPPIQHPYLSKSNFYTQPSISDSASTFSKVNSIQFSDLSEIHSATSSVTQNSLHSPSLTDNVLSSTPSRVKFDLSSVDEIQLEGPPPVPFVFPTTRSRAHPKSDKPVFRFRKKNKKAKPVTAGSPSYSNPITPSPEPVRSLRPISPIGRSSETSSDTSSSQLPTRDKRSAPSADTAATTSFVFPSSRSRAHSTSSPRKLKSKKEEKSKSSLNPQLLPSVWEQQYSRGIASNDKGGIIRPGTRSWRDVPILGNDIDIFSSTTTESYVPAPGTNHFIGRNLAMSDPGVDSSVGSGFQKTPYASSISSSEAEARRPLPVLSSDASFTPLSAQSSCIGISLSQSQDITETPGFSYPFDPYDPVLLESDKYTHKLLQKLISLASVSGNLKTKSEPSFHHYGNHPPLFISLMHHSLYSRRQQEGYTMKEVGLQKAEEVEGHRGRLPWVVETQLLHWVHDYMRYFDKSEELGY
ncbi:hypothetical protein K435DRAFT_872074 [Dendrothele bispora CBS 962.96]|uniref:Uncharacterized protein n=1 Tax=Dendrothele bispora (strain CBS 962.96) TaxID=1314807 RepID=A0A4S8L2N5_DENBC|nr:hypothetical protein K435DRAFT_872074 [Dendrothele bispora CBS 962.96]